MVFSYGTNNDNSASIVGGGHNENVSPVTKSETTAVVFDFDNIKNKNIESSSSPSWLQQRRHPFQRKLLPFFPVLKELDPQVLESNAQVTDKMYDDESRSSSTSSFTSVETSSSKSLDRHLTLTDLIAVGVGGTIGSGLFVLAGLVSHEYAGPSAVASWGISGLAALISGACYAELASRIPIAGSAYAYTFVAVGEWPAFLAAVCLSIEYLMGGAAIARSWGDKLSLLFSSSCNCQLQQDEGHQVVAKWWVWWCSASSCLGADHDHHALATVSPLAFLISTGAVGLLLMGVKESKQMTNYFTAIKITLIIFMLSVGAFYVQPTNWVPFFPFGWAGTFRGATGTFFG